MPPHAGHSEIADAEGREALARAARDDTEARVRLAAKRALQSAGR
jgi:hypothetical protein